MTAQLAFFEAPAPKGPEGFAYRPGLITPEAAAALAARFEILPVAQVLERARPMGSAAPPATAGSTRSRRWSPALLDHLPDPRPAVKSSSAARTRATTPSQSFIRSWRNRRSDGYHGLSSRPVSQRQSLS
jgi:hypothetical protein